MIQDFLHAKEIYNKQSDDYYKKQNEYNVLLDLRKKVYATLGDLKNKNILFVGCGDGTECISAIEQGANVTGIDISEKAIELANKKNLNAKFLVMNFEEPDFEQNSFDIIFAFFSIMYTNDLNKTLNNFRKILKDDGEIILVVPHPVRKMMKYNNQKYFVKGKKTENWKGIERFNYYRLFEDYIDGFVASNLKLVKLVEPEPIKENPEASDSEIDYPHFLIFKLKKS